jgi:serine phosphatase RsbU (regulator of sigma subunit)
LRLALLCGIILALLDLIGLFAGADRKLLDARFQARGRRPPSDRIALVTIDDATIGTLDNLWPLPRRFPATLIDAVDQGGARCVGLDLLFLGPERCDAESDSFLALASGAGSNVVHAFTFPPGDLDGRSATTPEDSALLSRHGIPHGGTRFASASFVAVPTSSLLDATPFLGHVSVALDPDGVVRRVPLYMRHRDRIYPALALSMLEAGAEGGEPPKVVEAQGGIRLSWSSGRNLFVPVDHEGATGVDFAGDQVAFPHTYSMLRVLQWYQADAVDSLREAFQGKLVLVGATSIGKVATDLGTTPFETAAPLMYVHANLLDALLQGRLFFVVPWTVRALVLVALALFVGLIAFRSSLTGALLATVGTSTAFTALDFGLFLRDIDFPPTAGLLVAPLVYSAIQAHRFLFVERRERTRAKELAIATRIQTGLLPRTAPHHPKLDVHGVNLPAMEVGGDYYDWILGGGQELVFAVGDVEGKGIGAALLMVHLHSSFQSEARQDRPLREIVETMHRSLHAATEARQFATFFLGKIDREARQLQYCSAGHNPALLVRGKTVLWLDATALPLGMILDGPPFEDRLIDLAPGDVLMVYSDGITEYPYRDTLYGEDRLAATATRLATSTSTARALAEGLLADIRVFSNNGPAGDDVTLVVIRCA